MEVRFSSRANLFMRVGGVVHFDLKHHTGKRGKIKREKKKKKIFPAVGMVIRMELAFCYCRQKKAGSRRKGTDRTSNC